MTVGELLVKVGVDATGLMAGMSKVESRMESFGTKLFYTGARITVGFSAPLAAASAAIAKFGLDFDQAMTQSLAIVDKVTPELRRQMEDTAKTLSETSKFSATEAAEAYYSLASAGYKAEDMLAALPIVAKFAQAGMMDMAKSSEFLTAAQAALGQKTDDVQLNMLNMAHTADVLTATNNLALGTVEDFANALTNKAGAALRLVNKDIEEGAAVLAAYAERGIKGKTAGQQLWMMMRDLQVKATENAGAFKQMNIRVFDSTGNMRNLADIIGDFEHAMAGASDKQKTMMFQLLGLPARSRAATMAIMGSSAAIRGWEHDLRNAGGTTEDVAKKQMQSLQNQLLAMRHTLENLAIEIFQSFLPVFEKWAAILKDKFIPMLKSAGEYIEHLSPRTKEWAAAFIGFGIALGPAVTALGSFVLLARVLLSMSGLPTLLSLFSKATLAGGIVLSPGGISAAVAKFAQQKSNALPAALGGTGVALTAEEKTIGLMATRLEAMLGLVTKIGAGFVEWAPQILAIYGLFKLLSPLVNDILDGISGTRGGKVVGGLFGAIGGEIGHIVQGFQDLLKVIEAVDNVLGIAGQGLALLGRYVEGPLDELDAYVGQWVSSAGRQIRDGFFKDFVNGKHDIEGVGAAVSKFASDTSDGFKTVAKDVITSNSAYTTTAIAIGAIGKTWEETNVEAKEHGGWINYIVIKTEEWYENLKLIHDQYKTNAEIAGQLPDIFKKAFDAKPTLDIFTQGIGAYNTNNPVNTRSNINRYTGDYMRFLSGNLGMLTPDEAAAQAAAGLGDGEPKLKGFEKKVHDAYESIMGEGESAMQVLVNVWKQHSAEIGHSADALMEFTERYKKLKSDGHVGNDYLEGALHLNTISPMQHAFTDNPFSVSEKFLDNPLYKSGTKFIEGMNEAYQMGSKYVDAFWSENAKGMEEAVPFMDTFPADLQEIIKKYMEWAKVSDLASNSIVHNQDKLKLNIDQIADQLSAKLADAQADVDQFTDNSAASQVRGMHRNIENQQQDFRRMIDRMKESAHKLEGVAREEADKEIAIAENKAKQIGTLEERANVLRTAAASGFSQVWLKTYKDVNNATILWFVDQRRHWLDWQITMEQNIALINSFGDLFTALGHANLGGAVAGMASAFSQMAKGMVAFNTGENDTERLTGLITVLGGVAKAFTSLKQAVKGGAISGAIAGAFAGFQTGAMFGSKFGPWGALIGAAVGGIWGMVTATKAERKALADVTRAFVDQEGGIDHLKARMEELGMATAELSNPMGLSAEEFAKELKKIDDLMQMKEAQKELVKAHGSMYDLMKEAALARTDLNGVFDATNLTEYNAALDDLNDKFKEVQDRLQFMSDAAAGLTDQVTGFIQQIDKALAHVSKKGEGIEKPEKHEGRVKSGSQTSMGDILKMAEAGLNRMAFTANNIFLTTLSSTGNILTSIGTVGDSLDKLIELEDKFKIHTSDANTEWLLGLRRIMNANPDLMLQIQGLAAQEVALTKAKRITQGQFDSFGQSAVEIYKELFQRTGNATASLQLMQPVIQGLWDAENKFGLKVDDATQALIDQSVEAGLIDTTTKPQFEDLYLVMKDIDEVLWSIAEALGVVRDTSAQVRPPDLNPGPLPPGYPPGAPPPPNYPGSPNAPDPNTPGVPPPPYNPPGSHQMAMGGYVMKYAQGGMIRYMANGGPTAGWGVQRWARYMPIGTDTQPIMATPGEYMIRKPSVDSIGRTNLNYMNATGRLPPPPTKTHGGTNVNLNVTIQAVDGPSVERLVRSGKFKVELAKQLPIIFTDNIESSRTNTRRSLGVED